ncbi:hypothetical protein VMT65_33065 [Nocardia sp. CDC153]|uniref:hypothetical protein n=1 Tax=Nocardia sp. CDC153 TaxID=3112167 RepID=UPI002DBC60C4|nr:hypothetical protein [Nocardia sp. CDC153]MEC3957907.1 hypothetical protein [Nocardia sp. CDC153]
MTIRHAPLFILALPVAVAVLAMVGAPAIALQAAVMFTAAPILLLLLLPNTKDSK